MIPRDVRAPVKARGQEERLRRPCLLPRCGLVRGGEPQLLDCKCRLFDPQSSSFFHRSWPHVTSVIELAHIVPSPSTRTLAGQSVRPFVHTTVRLSYQTMPLVELYCVGGGDRRIISELLRLGHPTDRQPRHWPRAGGGAHLCVALRGVVTDDLPGAGRVRYQLEQKQQLHSCTTLATFLGRHDDSDLSRTTSSM